MTRETPYMLFASPKSGVSGIGTRPTVANA